jgi:heme oxygenase
MLQIQEDEIKKPTILEKPFKFINYGDFYFPNKTLIPKLEELIIFSEGNVKKDIPNGSVWVYKLSEYNPEILKSDIGCGIGSMVIPKIDNYMDVVKAVNSLGKHIGQGNHFIDLTENHPLFKKDTNMLFIHSDFNSENKIPLNLKEAVQMQKDSLNQREEYLENLAKELGIKGNHYWDWTHNSVQFKNNKLIYRKGAININLTNGEGLLALNPFEGFYSYLGQFPHTQNSMQHGTGKLNKEKVDLSKYEQIKEGIVRALIVPEYKPENLYNEYNKINDFLDYHRENTFPMGFIMPKLVIKTKQ